MNLSATKLHVSDIAPTVIQSEIRAMSVECDRVGGINLAQGICDTELPDVVADGAVEAIRAGLNIYTRLDGIALLRHAIAAKFKRYNGLVVDPETQILVTNGATGALYASLVALLNAGDEVILFEPFYGYHVSTLLSFRMQPVIVPLEAPLWEIDFDAVRKVITNRTRAILINTPGNPSGKVLSLSELQGLAEIATEYDLFVLSDEIYEHFLYDGGQHISLATLPGMAERTITISGLSKTFSITGWRVGYLAAAPQWLSAIGYFHDLTYVCAPAPLQYGAAAGLLKLQDTDFYIHLQKTYQQKRDQLCEALSTAGLTPCVPAGAYYVLADASRVQGATSREKARSLLQRTGVAAVAGSAFFRQGSGETLLRFCFGKKPHDLDNACEQLQAAL